MRICHHRRIERTQSITLACFIVNQMFILYFERGLLMAIISELLSGRLLLCIVAMYATANVRHHHITAIWMKEIFFWFSHKIDGIAIEWWSIIAKTFLWQSQRYTRYARDAADFNLNSILAEGRDTRLCKSCNRYNSYTMLKVYDEMDNDLFSNSINCCVGRIALAYLRNQFPGFANGA